jgi:phosphoadenosine phosphosulfate reductase
MVKKRLASGEPCRKCLQTEELLRARGMWSRVDEVVWADEADPESPGMRLAREHGVEVAPFFLVEDGGAAPVVYTSALVLVRERLDGEARAEGSPAAASAAPAIDLAAARAELVGRAPAEILRWGLARFGDGLAIAFSGAEDVVLVDMAAASGLAYSVLTLDTGRLNAETLEFIERVRAHYGCAIHVTAPGPAIEDLVRTKGLFSFYRDGHEECCAIRKVEPLRRALGGYRAWATGQRRDQAATRGELVEVELDPVFVGVNGAPLVKLNPLARWSHDQVWAYIAERDVPTNPLHERGYASIGCAPCTRPIVAGQSERDGRWWWEDPARKECGLHAGNLRR